MNRKITVGIGMFILIISPFLAVAETTISEQKDLETTILANEVDVPIWTDGDSWKYDFEVEGDLEDIMSFNWVFKDMIFEVIDVTTSTYNMNIRGDVTGYLSITDIEIIRGELRDTVITGDLTVVKSNLGVQYLDIHLSGTLVILLIPKSFTIDLKLRFDPAYSALDFPLSVGKQWTIPLSEVHGNSSISLIPNPIWIDDLVGGGTAECVSIETTSVIAGTYECIKIISDGGDVTERYYAEDAGNIIKAWGELDNTIDIELKSTTYEGGGEPGAPHKPTKPDGPTNGEPGTTYTYTSSTIDPEGDNVFFWFDWGDNTNSGWIGPYLSGEPASAQHIWDRQGSFTVKVKAKDPMEHESKWSDPLSVIMPKGKSAYHSNLLQQLMYRFPRLERIIMVS